MSRPNNATLEESAKIAKTQLVPMLKGSGGSGYVEVVEKLVEHAESDQPLPLRRVLAGARAYAAVSCLIASMVSFHVAVAHAVGWHMVIPAIVCLLTGIVAGLLWEW